MTVLEQRQKVHSSWIQQGKEIFECIVEYGLLCVDVTGSRECVGKETQDACCGNAGKCSPIASIITQAPSAHWAPAASICASRPRLSPPPPPPRSPLPQMTFPAVADADPDPTTQIPWPGRSKRQSNENVANLQAAADSHEGNNNHASNSNSDRVDKKQSKNRLSTWNLITLSLGMCGSQIAWTVELGYGTPFLLKLGLSEQLTSLVWLAGPISGLVAQPLIGAISDKSTSKYRRRYWIILSTAVLTFSALLLAYCEDIAAIIVDVFGGGSGDWDPVRQRQVKNTAIGFAVLAFYLLDFALNALQASLRNLLLDIAPPEQLSAGNAWHGRMLHAGNIIGYGFGFLPLASLPLLRLLGGSQFRKFCIVATIFLDLTVLVTCMSHEEKATEAAIQKSSSNNNLQVLKDIWDAIVKLPKPIRRVCYVQVFAFMGWFPFLFYATTYIGQVMAYEQGKEPDDELATRMGELALLGYSIIAVAAGTILPHLARRDKRLMPHEGDTDEDAELTRIRNTVLEWRAEAARKGKPLRLPVMPFLLRNVWTGAMLLFAVLMFSTFFIETVFTATIMVGLAGISWAVACWAPFAIIMEFLKELNAPKPTTEPHLRTRPGHQRFTSTPALHRTRPSESGVNANERQPLLRRRSYDELDAAAAAEQNAAGAVVGGTILGIHNLAIVMPQFVIAIMSSLIFRAVDGVESVGEPGTHNTYYGKNGVAWVLRFGGLCALFGALIARRVPPTRAEKEMRRRLGEMRVLKTEGFA